MSDNKNSLSYSKMIWRQFSKSRISIVGLYIAVIFMLIAVFAPFIAGRLPLMWTTTNGDTIYPLFREFFAPMDSKERALEYVFNFMLLFLPLAFLAYKYFRAHLKAILPLLAILLMIPFYSTQARNQPDDYWQLELEGKGQGVFPLIPSGAYQQAYPPKIPPTWYKATPENTRGYSVLGSDEVGRDVLVRIIYGARVSLAVGFVSVGIATIIGLIIGSIAGYFGGIIDILISRAIELIMCFPTFFLILTIIAFLEHRSILNIMLVIGLTGWTGTARLIRGEILKQRSLDYVAGAKALGAGSTKIIFKHIMPNAISPVLVGVSFGIASAILTESTLSFLGLGVSSPTATWGEILNEGRDSPLVNWWLTLFPGIIIFLSMTAYNLVGEGVRDAMDPKLNN